MAEKKRKSVIVETAKQMLVKIPEHLLAKVQAAVLAEKGTATPATDIEIIKAADKSSRTRCRKLHAEIDGLLQQLYAMLHETSRLLKAMSCGADCSQSKKCICGLKVLDAEHTRLIELHKVVIKIVNLPRQESGSTLRCCSCDKVEEHCGCLVFNFNGELPEDDDDEDEDEDDDFADEDLDDLIDDTDEDDEDEE